MKKIKFAILFVGVFMLSFKAFSIAPPSNLEVKIKYDVSSSDFNPMNPLASIDQTGDAYVSFIVQLSGNEIESIEVTLKRSAFGEVLISKSFAYGTTGTLSDGTTYFSKDKVVELGLGSFNNLSTYYAEVKVKDINGNISDAIIKVKAN